MTPELVHQLVRMGLMVGVHVEHPRTVIELDELARSLSAPIMGMLADGRSGEVTSEAAAPAETSPLLSVVNWAGAKSVVAAHYFRYDTEPCSIHDNGLHACICTMHSASKPDRGCVQHKHVCVRCFFTWFTYSTVDTPAITAHPRCVAHGNVACWHCSLNPASCGVEDGPDDPGCSAYASTGMHWDTCPNRVCNPCGAAQIDPNTFKPQHGHRCGIGESGGTKVVDHAKHVCFACGYMWEATAPGGWPDGLENRQ